MSARKSASQLPQTLNRFLKSRALLKQPPPAFYPLVAHPPAPSLVRAFPARPQEDLPAHARTEEDSPASLYDVARDKLNRGVRLTAQEDAALLHPHAHQGARTHARRKAPRPANTRSPRPWNIVFPEDSIRTRFFQDHPFEAYRPTSLVEGEQVAVTQEPSGKAWTQLSQRSTNPSADDCIAFVLNLVEAHGLPLSSAYPHGVAQFRTLRAEHETATRAAQLEAQAHGAVFFGALDRALAVEDRVLDEWSQARAIQDGFAASAANRGAAAAPQAAVAAQGAEGSVWAPAEARPAFGAEDESLFSGGVEYLGRFARTGDEVRSGAVLRDDGLLVGSQA
ncbi:mitochondrial ribosomal small subunit component [Rhodotorula kratochvilovae]